MPNINLPSDKTAIERAIALERDAHRFRSEEKTEEAFNAFDEAAALYRERGEHLKAAVCYASAATCWNIRTGWQPLRNAATRNNFAAHEAMKAEHPAYARTLFLEAALLYEKEGDFANYSACFYESKRAELKLSWEMFVYGRKDEQAPAGSVGRKERVLALGRWFVNGANHLIWGYGERPFRTLVAALGVIFVSALVYFLSGQILVGGLVRPISFFEGLYLSVVTYTTVGFGDYLPGGGTRVFAMLEALSGIFFTPLFLIGLTRRYLRMYR